MARPGAGRVAAVIRRPQLSESYAAIMSLASSGGVIWCKDGDIH